MDSQRSARGWLNCSCKAVTKFCLLYYITLNLVVLLFTSVNQENLTRSQMGWYWAFLVSLFLTASLSVTSLMILFYTDYYGVMPDEPEPAKTNGNNKEEFQAQNDENSSSFKTVLTINSTLPDRASPQEDQPSQLLTLKPSEPPDASAFVNLTPSTKSPVTLVDMRKNKLDRKVGKTAAKVDTLKTVDNNAANDDTVRLTIANLATIPNDVFTRDAKEKANQSLKARKKLKAKKKTSS